MKQTKIYRMVFFAVLTMMLFTVFGLVHIPAQASSPESGLLQITDVPPGPDSTAIVPETGGAVNDDASGSWILWVVLGIAIIALIVAIASGRATRTDI